MPKNLIQKSDNTKVDIGSAEYPRYSKPWIPDYLEGMLQYISGNYLNRNAQLYSNNISGKVENVYPEFDLLLLKGFKPRNSTLSKRANWQGDSVELTKERLSSGGFDRLGKHLNPVNELDFDALTNYVPGRKIKLAKKRDGEYTSEIKDKILKSKPANWTSEQAGIRPNNIGVAKANGVFNGNDNWGVVSDAAAPYTKGQPLSDLNAHEFTHYVFSPESGPNIDIYKGVNKYLKHPAEINARGTQIKNYFGLKENEPLTEEMLRYAKNHYVKDRGYDNNITQFFNGIKNWKEMAKWIQEYSPFVSIPLMMNNGNNTTNE